MAGVTSSARDVKRAYIAFVLVCLAWGTTYLGIRVALESVPPALLAGLRWTAAGLLLSTALRLTGQTFPSSREWPSVVIMAVLMLVIGNGGVVWAEQYVPSGLAAVLIATVPFWSVFVEAVLPAGERATMRSLAGLSVGFTGIIVLVWPALTIDGGQGHLFILGVAAVQLACVGWAIGTAYIKRNVTRASPLAVSSLQMIAAGIIFLAIGTATGEWSRLAFTTRSTFAMIHLVFIGSIVGYSAYVYALRGLPISTVSLYAYVNPIIAVVLGTVLLSEPLSLRIALAALLVFAGVAIVRSAPGPAKASVPVRGER